MSLVMDIVLGMLALAGGLSVLRLVRGTSLADRIVGLDTTIVMVACGIAVFSAKRGSGVFLDALVVVTLLGFTGTALVARFIQQRGAR